jgi:hypothetical protein
VKVWFQNRRMKWRHQESKERRDAAGTSADVINPADVIMQCDVTGNELLEEEEEDVAIEDDEEGEEADSTADREISSTRF